MPDTHPTALQHLRAAVSELAQLSPDDPRTLRIAFALGKLILRVGPLFEHGHGWAGVEVAYGRYRRWSVRLDGPPEQTPKKSANGPIDPGGGVRYDGPT